MTWIEALVIVAVVYFAANLVVRRLGISASALDWQSLRDLLSRRSDPVCVVDLRSREEYAEGHIPTAICIPYGTIAQTPPQVPAESLVVLYCRTGSRSAVARARLRRLGYTNVVNFGPVHRWKGELARGASRGPAALAGTPSEERSR